MVRDGPSVESDARASQDVLSDVRNNAALPVGSLPSELLVEILRLAAGDAGLDGIVWTTKVTGVCHYWRTVIVNMPLFWRDTELSRNPRFIELCLARSDGAGVSVHLPMQLPDCQTRSTIDFLSVASLLAPHHRRITHMDLYLDSNDETPDSCRALLSTLEACLPGLVSLVVATKPNFSFTLKQNHLPSLQQLSLNGATIDWSSLRLSQLKLLELSHITHPDDGHCSPLASLLDLLDACVSLESFSYKQWETVCERTVAAHRIVSLPRMRRFHISGLPGDISTVVAHLSLPKQAHLSLELTDLQTDSAPDYHFPVLETVLPRDTTHLPALTDARHVMVWFEDFNLRIYADEQRTEFWDSQVSKNSVCGLPSDVEAASAMPSLCMMYRLSGSESDYYVLNNIARELSGVFPSTVETFVIRGAIDIVDTETWKQMLTAFPHVEHLEFIAIECDMKTFPLALAPTSTGIPCPHLRKLVLRYEPNEEDGGQEMLSELCVTLRRRNEAQCRLESLSIQVGPIADDTLFTPTDVVNRLPTDLEDIERNLEMVVDALEIMLLIDGD